MNRSLIIILLLGLCGCNPTPEEPTTEECQGNEVVNTYVEISAEGFPTMEIPNDNPTSDLGIALGRRLFYDPILSRDSSMSCGSCHQQKFNFSDGGKSLSFGVDGLAGNRNTPSLPNAGWLSHSFWDGRAATLEDQAFKPVTNPIEMDLTWQEAEKRLNRHADYPTWFEQAFGTSQIDSTLIVQAIAQFERTFISNQSKYDLFLADKIELSDDEEAGFALFFSEKAECFHCHGTIQMTDQDFRNIGLESEYSDFGLAGVTGQPTDIGKFKTPSLRNVEFSAPYMHDGRFATLDEVLKFYSDSIQFHINIDPLMRVGGFDLTEEEQSQLIAFLMTLSDTAFINNPAFSNPWD